MGLYELKRKDDSPVVSPKRSANLERLKIEKKWREIEYDRRERHPNLKRARKNFPELFMNR